MSYKFLADLVIGAHFLFVLFVLFGGLLVFRWRWLAMLHLPAALWGAAIEFAGWICPLTPLEQWLRRRGGLDSYQGGFIEHYIMPVLYPAGLTRGVQLILGAVVLVGNVGIYWWLFNHRPAPPESPRGPAAASGRRGRAARHRSHSP